MHIDMYATMHRSLCRQRWVSNLWSWFSPSTMWAAGGHQTQVVRLCPSAFTHWAVYLPRTLETFCIIDSNYIGYLLGFIMFSCFFFSNFKELWGWRDGSVGKRSFHGSMRMRLNPQSLHETRCVVRMSVIPAFLWWGRARDGESPKHS